VPTVSAPTYGEWEEIAGSDPAAVAEQFPAWMTAITSSSSLVDRSRLYRFDDGRRFVLPLVARRGVPTPAVSLWSYPNAWGIGGPVGTDLDADVVDRIVDDLHTLGAARVSIRVEAGSDSHWEHLASDERVTVLPRTTHVAEFGTDPETYFAQLPGETRRKVRRAERCNTQIRVGRGGALLDDHYRLFERSIERWATKQHEPVWLATWRGRRRDPLEKLQAIGQHLGDRFCVVVGDVDGVPAASAIVLLGPTVRYTRGALDTAIAGSSGVNDAVQWRSIELAMQYGARRYNMGESGSSVGISAFKERFGAVAASSGEYRIERLPLTDAGRAARSAVKRLIRFED
jgi:hypothetical protein